MVQVHSADYNHGNAVSIELNTQDLGGYFYSRKLNDATLNFSDRVKAACRLMGSTQIDRLQGWDAWAIVVLVMIGAI